VTRPHDLSTRLWHCGRLSLVCEPRDIWIGVYVAPGAVYVCLVPCFPLKWERRPGGPGRALAKAAEIRALQAQAERPAEWMVGDWRAPERARGQ